MSDTQQNSDAAPREDSPSSESARLDKGDAKTMPARLDPTRYGDWEKNGRCIDF